MDPVLPWYKSAIIRQQVVQLIVASTAFFGVVTDIDWSVTVEAIFAGIAAVVAVWTIITRLFKPAPNMTATAAQKEQQLVAQGKIPAQGGFARVALLAILALASSSALLLMSGCAGTQAAYRVAKDDVGDLAYVVAEHYSAVLKEAADIAQSPGTPQNVKDALKRADQAVKRFIVGDPATELPSLKTLVDRFEAVGDAETEADLQNSVNAAIRELSKFSKAVKAARGSP